MVSGERSRDGEGSLDDAVEDPPGDPTGWGLKSSKISNNPTTKNDLNMI